MDENYLKSLVINYITDFLYKLGNTPFQYYYLNKDYPQCTVENLTDYDIAKQYPHSGERLLLDCWSLVNEYCDITPDDWESFVRVIDFLVEKIEKERHEKS